MSHFKSHRGVSWYYETSGSGEAVLMIHGMGGSGALWQGQREFLETDFQVITIDLPGHGQSSWAQLTLTETAQEIRQLVAHLGISQFSILASSLGGLIAFEIYRMMPNEVMRISLVGSIPKFARGPHYPAGLDLFKIRTMSAQFDGDYGLILDIFFRSLFTMKERHSERFKWVKEVRLQMPLPQREALKHCLDLLEKADLRDRLASVICPLQFITGSEDYICPREIMDWVAEHTYNARFDFVEGAGHLPFLVEVEEFNRLLEDFLLN